MVVEIVGVEGDLWKSKAIRAFLGQVAVTYAMMPERWLCLCEVDFGFIIVSKFIKISRTFCAQKAMLEFVGIMKKLMEVIHDREQSMESPGTYMGQ